jgi:LPPG:FO 2-phospho-L-lactate transferase
VILIGPSNPWLSIAPILAVPGMRDLLVAQTVPRVAVTPIIAGTAVKGPAAKIMSELGYEVSASSVAAYYNEVLTGFVYDKRDAVFNSHGLQSVAFDTMMKTDVDKAALAERILVWLENKETV